MIDSMYYNIIREKFFQVIKPKEILIIVSDENI